MLKTIGSSYLLKFISNHYACFSTIVAKPPKPEKPPHKKTTSENIKITLISTDDDLSIVNLAEAQKISKRRDLKLVKIVDFDTKTSRPVYKLMTGAEYHSEEIKRKAEQREAKKDSIKGQKLLPISSKIGKNDLDTRLKNLSKWLNKKYEVRVVINGSSTNQEVSDQIVSRIEKDFSEIGKITQKQTKGIDLKFNVIPRLENIITPNVDQQKREIHTEREDSKGFAISNCNSTENRKTWRRLIREAVQKSLEPHMSKRREEKNHYAPKGEGKSHVIRVKTLPEFKNKQNLQSAT